ncbi:succinate dehydrogenase, cytochrome b556 subunit, partial [Ectopseudomonas hydrolytica]|uniref:succinate dehydrogenase, cytochrome b556 subunit n=1 Tax=Ectopseudomonas hydrolytica TaxID=2493633 RepID=UPI003C2FAB56
LGAIGGSSPPRLAEVPLTWLVYSSFIYHLVAGIRHLVMDVGVGHTLKGSNRASTIVLVVSGVLMVAGAVWIW